MTARIALASGGRPPCYPGMRHPALLALLLGLAVFARAEPADLLAGPGFPAGWRLVTDPASDLALVCHRQPDGSLAVAGQPGGYLATTASHADYRLHAEWRWSAAPGNSGVLVHISSGPKDRIWPLCYQVQTKRGFAGDLLPMAGATFATSLTTPPGAKTPTRAHMAPDSEKPPGEWNSCDITCRGDTIEVAVNGVLQNRVTGCSLRSGAIGFQLEGAPYELRHVTLTPLE